MRLTIICTVVIQLQEWPNWQINCCQQGFQHDRSAVAGWAGYWLPGRSAVIGWAGLASRSAVVGQADYLAGRLLLVGLAYLADQLLLVGLAYLAGQLFLVGLAYLKVQLLLVGLTYLTGQLLLVGLAYLADQLLLVGLAYLADQLSLVGLPGKSAVACVVLYDPPHSCTSSPPHAVLSSQHQLKVQYIKLKSKLRTNILQKSKINQQSVILVQLPVFCTSIESIFYSWQLAWLGVALGQPAWDEIMKMLWVAIRSPVHMYHR